MNITGGRFRGRKIKHPGGKIRPTLSKIRQAVFNSLGNDLRGNRWVDLFTGTGIMGMEALSRGAENVIFMDIDRRTLDAVSDNLRAIDIPAASYSIIKVDSMSRLGLFTDPYDIIYADPPFGFRHMQKLITELEKSFNGTLIWELPFDNKYQFQYSIREKKYGNISLVFERKNEE